MTAGALFAGNWPSVDLETITGGCALILAPHPDDESLGCGGLIAESCARGQPSILVVLTDGTGSHPLSARYPSKRLRALREAETREAAARLGLPLSRVIFLGLPDRGAPSAGPVFVETVGKLIALIQLHGCRSVLATWRHDPHSDHEAAALLADAAARQAGIPHWAYPVWGRTLPADAAVRACTAVRLDIRRSQETKRQAIRAHRSQWAGLITDDPTGFQMTPGFMELFDQPAELFLTTT